MSFFEIPISFDMELDAGSRVRFHDDSHHVAPKFLDMFLDMFRRYEAPGTFFLLT